MKTILYHFSATGNSLVVARDLAKILGSTELVPIPHAMHEKLSTDAERVGIIFPVYWEGLPNIVSKFIRKMRVYQGRYVFAICTCGGTEGGTLLQAAKELKEQRVDLSAGFSVKMPGNYIRMYDSFSKEKQAEMFDSERKRMKRIARIVKGGLVEPVEKSFFLFNWIASGIIYPIKAPRFKRADRSFWVTKDCNSCGTCAKVCPVENIKLKDGIPVWRHKCEQCMACLQWCPKKAIQAGNGTLKRKRYRHPEVTLKDIIDQK
jgi:ferredoxin